MCAGLLYSYIQDYNRRESFSLKKKKNIYIYIYSGPFTLPSRPKMTGRFCFLSGR